MLALALAVTLAAAPAEDGRCRVAVLAVESADAELAAALTEAVASGARDASGCLVITPKDVRSMLSFAADQAACAADNASCIAELGAALGVQRIVATTISKLGHDASVSVRLIDIDHATVLAGKERVVTGDARALRDSVHEMTRAVFGAWSPATTALVVGGGVGAGLGLALGVLGGAGFAWSSSTLADKSAGGVDKANALAVYTPTIAGTVIGAVLVVAGVAASVTGLVLE